MEFRRVVQLPVWDEETKQKVISFWRDRKVNFEQISDRNLKGVRGSILGNLTSFDMRNLYTEVTISVSEDNQCTCTLDIVTWFQQITSWNREYWQLELESFESVLLRDDTKEQEWENYRKKARKSDIAWVGRIFLVCCLLGFVLGGGISAIPSIIRAFLNR